MSTLKIRKLQSGAFKHVDSIDGDFFLGRFNFKQEFNKAFLVEAYGAKRREYVIANISVYNYLGTAETFTNWTDLINRLVDLGYTGIDTNSIPSGSGVWGSITGNIASQTDLQNELNTKLDKVTTVDVEKVYIKNADGTQGMKAVSEFGGSVQSVTGDSVDNTDTLNPIINAIPLSGTTVGNPVSGNIEIVGAGADLRIFSMGDSDILQNNIVFGDGVFAFGVKNLIDGGGSAIQVHENYIEVIAQNDSVGIKGSEDFTENITDLDYTQKIYVDTYTQRTTATSGTVNIDSGKRDLVLIHEAGATTALTLNLPTSPKNNQKVTIMSVGGIVGLTLTTVVGTIIGAVTTLAALGTTKLIWNSSQSKWYKIS